MADGLDKPIMPKEEKKNLPEAIPVDDKGQPLPDPSENLSGYIVTSGVEHLKKTFASVETDDTVRETMEPPQQTNFFKKHRSGSRGYDYYGIPAGSIPKDANGIEPSPLSKLFAEAEVLEDDSQDVQPQPAAPIKQGKIETPKQRTMPTEVSDDPKDIFEKAGYHVLEDTVNAFKLAEARKDTDTPRLRDMYKTNTKVIFQSDADAQANGNKLDIEIPVEQATDVFTEPSQLTKVKTEITKKELKAKIRLEKQKAKIRRKNEKALRKLQLKAEKIKSKPITDKNKSKLQKLEIQIAELISKTAVYNDIHQKAQYDIAQKERIVNEQKAHEAELNAQKVLAEKAEAEEKAKLAAQQAEIEKQEAKKAEEKAKQAQADAEKKAQEVYEKAQEQRQEAEKAVELANKQKETAQQAAQLAAQEANKKLAEEREKLRLEKEESARLHAAEQAEINKELESQKAAAQQARMDVEKIKAELENMRRTAALALAQKQEAEEAARLAREEKAKLDEELAKQAEAERIRQEELAAKRAARKAREEAQKAETDKIRQERDLAIAKAKAEKELAIAKAKAEKEAAIAKAKAEKEAAIAKIQNAHKRESIPKVEPKDIFFTKPVPSELKINKENIVHRSKE